MGTTVSTGSTNYTVPAYGDSGWAQGAGNLSSYLVALASTKLDIAGGNFTLTANVNFGATYGVLSKYFQTVASSPATAGVIRLAIGDTIDWGTANNALGVSGTTLQWNGADVLTGAVAAPTENREVYTAGTALNNYTGSLTVFNMVGSYLTNGVNLWVLVNGLAQPIAYYTETSTTSITFKSNLNTGDTVELRWTTY